MASLFQIVLKGLNGAFQYLEFDVCGAWLGIRLGLGLGLESSLWAETIRVIQHHCISPGAGGRTIGDMALPAPARLGPY